MKRLLGAIAFYFLLATSSTTAQQNLFNIPSGDITPRGKLFYQHQLNFYSANELESKSHLVYGIGKGWDLGVNFVDLPLSFGQGGQFVSFNDNSMRKPLYPLLMFTLQKQFVLKEDVLFLNVGTQIGPNLSNEFENKKLAMMTYALIRWQPFKKGYLIVGPYHTNDVFVGGNRDQFGLMFGYEYKLSDKWLLMADFISGNHKKSQTVIRGGYNVSNKLQIFLGSLLAFQNNKLDNGIVVEINWYGWNFMDWH